MRGPAVCHVMDYGAPTAGSFVPYVASVSRAVLASGARFAAIAAEVPAATWPADLRNAGAEVHLVRRSREVAGLLRSIRPAIVHAHFTRFDLPVLLCGSGARVFWHVHSVREAASRLAAVKSFLKYRVLSGRVETVIAVSQAIRSQCIELGARAERVRVIYNGIDVEAFRPPSVEERASARARFGVEGPEPVLLFFERTPQKGGAAVREALRRLPGLRLLVVGGSHSDRARFGDPPRVTSLERVADARALYWAADVLAFASVADAFGLVVAEALACGLPVAASDIPAVREICAGVESVSVFPPEDGAALARAVEQALSRTDTSAGRARVVERFNLSRWVGETIQLYGM